MNDYDVIVAQALVDGAHMQRLYELIRQPKPIADRQFEIEFLDSGVEAFAFTFG